MVKGFLAGTLFAAAVLIAFQYSDLGTGYLFGCGLTSAVALLLGWIER